MASSGDKRVAVVDIQFFQVARNLFCKEVAIYSSGYTDTETFAPPFSYHYLPVAARRSVHYNEGRLGMEWRSGEHNQQRLSEILKKMCHGFDIIYIKGEEKFKFLIDYSNQAQRYPEELFHCVRLHLPVEMIIKCNNHFSSYFPPECAKNNAKILYKHLFECGIGGGKPNNDDDNEPKLVIDDGDQTMDGVWWVLRILHFTIK